VYSIERTSREYSAFMVDKQIFMKTISFMNILTGSMRSAVFKAMERYLVVCKEMKNMKDINEISMSLMAIS
jgi:hypothetical protein